MHTLYMKQKALSLRGRFSIKDDQEKDRYLVEGSFLKLPKTFLITTTDGEEVATITKKTFSFRPTFFVEVAGQTMTIEKEFSLFKARYTIDAADIEIDGNWWDMNFQVKRQGEVVGSVEKKWLSFGDSYEIQVMDAAIETILIALVVAIDCVKADDAANASS
ncbi:LURP-one-related/scramblase family protein [Exiguobacterium antarcticum]|uniref:LURP-one-related family protein n=1 Tax=Exiguobacterium antarcticum TaxID=132920 RepID=A0ABT6R4B5_9BACL|nr:LURP-one-related family protein [Exiguobacterium antarcticum]AFS71899.1 LURP-like protein [Exiguobacterium antarcticum B7]MDI3235638.1 LURP-one-related family protein [Exiguobacterium antarcticum]